MFKPATLLLGLSLVMAPAYAAVQNVACNGDTVEDATPTDSKKIDDALDALLASPDTVKTLNLSGTCVPIRTIELRSFPNVSIVGPATISAPIVGCGAAPPAPPSFAGLLLSIIDTRNFTLRNINLSGGVGAFIQDSAGSFTGVNIDSSRSEGVSVQGASNLGLQGATLTGPSPGTLVPSPNNITNSCGNGLNIGIGSTVAFLMLGSISNNAGAGVIVNGGSFFANGCCAGENAGSVAIENNRAGIIVTTTGGTAGVNGGFTCLGVPGTALVRGNQEWGAFVQGPSHFSIGAGATLTNNHTAPTTPFAVEYKAGIYASYGSSVFVLPGAVVRSTNGGHAIRGDMQAMVRLGNLPVAAPPPGSSCVTPTFADAIVRSNSHPALRLTNMSIGQILSTTTVNGSGSGGGGDASCDQSSKLVGVTGGIANNNCAAN